MPASGHSGRVERLCGFCPTSPFPALIFEITGQFCNSMSWEKGHKQIFSCAAELFQEWAVCLPTWERSMRQMQTHASKNPGTPSLLLAFTDPKSAKESNANPPNCADHNVNEISFTQWFCWGQVIPSLGPAGEIAMVRETWGGWELISWIAVKTTFRKLSVERCFQHISGMMSI